MPAGTQFLMEKGMLGEMLQRTDIDRGQEGMIYRFEVRNHMLHAVHPLGWFRRIRVSVDGRDIASEKFYFVVRGQWIRGDDVPNIQDIYWYLCEPAEVYFEQDAAMTPGAHRVEFELFIARYEGTNIIDFDGRWPLHSQTVSRDMRLEEQ